MKEPLWKTILNWGTVIVFLTLPLVVFTLHVYAKTHPGWILEGREGEFKYVFEFQRNITVLVFGLAGLRTWEGIKNGKDKHPHEEHYEKRVIKSHQPPQEEKPNEDAT